MLGCSNEKFKRHTMIVWQTLSKTGTLSAQGPLLLDPLPYFGSKGLMFTIIFEIGPILSGNATTSLPVVENFLE